MRSLLVLAALALASPAAADGFYFTEEFGGSDVKSDLGEHMSSAFRFRVAVGMRHGPWSLEANIGAHIRTEGGDESEQGDYYYPPYAALTTYGLDLKYTQQAFGPVEMYLRGGLAYALMDDEAPGKQNATGFAGRGVVGGAGVQLKGKVRALGFLAWPFFFLKIGPKVTAALFVDASYSYYRLHPDGRLDALPNIDAKITSITGGFAIGSDF
jgi:hypothetical protein